MELAFYKTAKQARYLFQSDAKAQTEQVDGHLLFVTPSVKKDSWDDALSFLEKKDQQALLTYVKRFDFKRSESEVLSFDQRADLRVVLAVLPQKPTAFSLLELSRKALGALVEGKVRAIAVDLRAASTPDLLADAVASASLALVFEPKHYGDEPPEEKKPPRLVFVHPQAASFSQRVQAAKEQTLGTNLVRYLSALAGNDLIPSSYVSLTQQLAKDHGLKSEFYSLKKLEALKAGAFLAVARAGGERGGGIVHLSYVPKKPRGKVAFVGKGITFDTGGSQLKTGEYMYGMNGDMAGSAVALALILLAKQQQWPWEVHAYLAITENLTGPDAYRPNDVVRSMRGKTIEVTDSDAEGRMVLADTLWLASQLKPQLMMDFATLTGACIRALGTSYSGVYTNRSNWETLVIEAGKQSGERVWPFPSDPDYGRCLKSTIADIKQCRLKGGSDHIEAGYFLSQFVPETIAWVHVDLSAAESEEGLAHVPPGPTGFGVRFASYFVSQAMMSLGSEQKE